MINLFFIPIVKYLLTEPPTLTSISGKERSNSANSPLLSLEQA